jgi:hypothetical protein
MDDKELEKLMEEYQQIISKMIPLLERFNEIREILYNNIKEEKVE